MPRPIKMSEEIIRQMVSEFEQAVRDLKTVDGKVSLHSRRHLQEHRREGRHRVFIHRLPENDRAHPGIFLRSRVARYGRAHFPRRDFLSRISSSYPQKVTGATVNTDQEAYAKWMQELDDETFNSLRFQGHSHVNMGVSPSSTDIENQGRIVSQFGSADHFYIFMIWNNSMDFSARVFDMSAQFHLRHRRNRSRGRRSSLQARRFHQGRQGRRQKFLLRRYGKASAGKEYRYSDTNDWEKDDELMRKFRYMN